MRTLVFVAALVPCLASARLAQAHIRLTSPAARYVQDDNGLKTAPCGSGTATGAITALVPGQTLTVTWKESVSHAGHYRIALSANASDFTEPANLTVPTTLPAWDLADGIQDKTGTQTYSQTVQLPNAECPSCVLQLLQIMSAGTDGTNTGTFSGVYHACADVSISAGNADAGTARDGAIVVDVRASNSSDSSAVRMDAVQAAGGATGTGGSGGAGTSGSTAGTGGAIGAGGSGTGGSGVGAGGAAGNGTGGNGGTVGASGGTTGGTTSASGGSAGGSGGSVSSSGGAGGAGSAASSGSGGNTAGSGGVVGSGGNSATQTTSSANGCGCQLGSHSRPGIGLVVSVLALCFSLVRRPRQGDGN